MATATNRTIGQSGVRDILDVFGQNPRLSRLYTQLCFCFELANADHDNAVKRLEIGLDRLCQHFPWTAGRVVCDVTGLYRIVHDNSLLRINIQDLKGKHPPMDAIRAMGFPFSMLDEDIIADRKTMPDESDDPAPVFLIKATFVHNGLFLNFDAQHNCMDMAGQCEVIRLFAKACRGDPFTPEEIHTGNLPRHDIIPPLDTSSSEHSPKPPPSAPEPLPPPPTASTTDTVWSYFLFSPQSLADLKSLASTSITVPFISTDDALSALIWQSVSRARLPDLLPSPPPSSSSDPASDAPASDLPSTFDRQVDARSALGIPSGYTGNVVHKASVRLRLRKEVCAWSLGALASALRAAIADRGQIARATCESAEALRKDVESHRVETEGSGRGGEKSQRKVGISAADLRVSSWAKEECAGFVFGEPLGRARAVRRPRFEAWEGLGYFMPRARDGEVAVGLCLRTAAMERLKADQEFGRFGRYVG